MLFLENVLYLLILIGVMILVHELGHYWVARACDVKVEAFSFGFGPRLFGFRKGETDFKVCAIPFGGYVKMAGEQSGDDTVADPRGFMAKPRWQRLLIGAAGPAMNIALAVVLLTGLFMVRFPKPTGTAGPATIGYLAPDSPAAKAGLREGDRIVQIEDQVNPTWDDIAERELLGANRPLTVGVERGGHRLVFQVTPVLDAKEGVGKAGWEEQNRLQVAALVTGMDAERAGLRPGDVLVSVNGQPIYSLARLHEVIRKAAGQAVQLTYSRGGVPSSVTVRPQQAPATDGGQPRWMIGVQLESQFVLTKLSLPEALTESVKQNARGAKMIVQFIGALFERRTSAKNLSGPLYMGKIAGDAARQGAASFVGLMAMVSLNLAIFNLLPVPILDGGVILMLLVEMVMRRDLSLNVKEAVFKVGFVFLMMVVVFVLYNDITKLLPG